MDDDEDAAGGNDEELQRAIAASLEQVWLASDVLCCPWRCASVETWVIPGGVAFSLFILACAL